LSSVRGLVRQRQSLRAEAAESIAAGWGGRQLLLGPALVLQATCSWTDKDGTVTKSRHLATQLPSRLEVAGRAVTEVRNRGIHEIPVYRTHLDVELEIQPPALTALDWDCGRTKVEAASIVFALSDARGIDEITELVIGDARHGWSSGTPLPHDWSNGVQAAIPVELLYPAATPVAMRFAIDLRGTDRFTLAPAGGLTELRLSSDWPSPSFDGAFLPAEREIRADGFDASWKVSELARPVASLRIDGVGPELSGSAFGFSLFQEAGVYLKAERSLKYGFLFVALTFLTFYLFELTGARRAHILQYGLVGGALCVFYLLLLSISERSSFTLAYLAAATATTTQITLYGRAFLASNRRAAVLGAVLAALYTCLYWLVGLEEAALLLGSIGLFVVIAITMWLTREVGSEPLPAT
jgi:inner membrane protein